MLDGISLTVGVGERIGLVGPNGAGKSTLARIIAGAERPDSGTIAYASDIALGYLPERPDVDDDLTIEAFVSAAIGDIDRMATELRSIERSFGVLEGAELETALQRYGEVQERFEARGGYSFEERFERTMLGLGLGYLQPSRNVRSLSSGERSRLALAGVLLEAPNALILDEPTNHLDAPSLAWFETYLADCGAAVILISHDRTVLNSTVKVIYEIPEHGPIHRYGGNFDFFLERKAEELHVWRLAYERQQEELQQLKGYSRRVASPRGAARPPSDNDKATYKFKGERSLKADTKQARAIEKRIERVQAELIPKPPEPLQFRGSIGGGEEYAPGSITATGLTKRYGERLVLAGVDIAIEPRSRMIIEGPNGAGKSTLLRLLSGVETPDSGFVQRSERVRIGYLPQEPPVGDERSLLDHFYSGLVGDRNDLQRELYDTGLFHPHDMRKRSRSLSIGQRKKLQLAKMIASHPNMLLLDEPTNYLSLDLLDQLERALEEFAGSVVAITHDRRFRERVGGDVWHLADGVIRPGPFDPPPLEAVRMRAAQGSHALGRSS